MLHVIMLGMWTNMDFMGRTYAICTFRGKDLWKFSIWWNPVGSCNLSYMTECNTKKLHMVFGELTSSNAWENSLHMTRGRDRNITWGNSRCTVKSMRKKLYFYFFIQPSYFYQMNDFLGKQWHTECSLRESLATCAWILFKCLVCCNPIK